MSKIDRNKQAGFTITELSLSMAMLSVLLVIILLSILNIIGIYNKGLTLKRANQAGRAIASEVQTSFHKTDSTSTIADVTWRQTEQVDGEQVYTRLCTGHYSFIWNVHSINGSKTNEEFEDSSDGPLGMVRVRDSSSDYCRPNGSDYKKPAKSDVNVLLGDDLVIRQPVSVQVGKSEDPAVLSTTKLVRFVYTISTPEGENLIFEGGSAKCQGGSGDDFCALNTFVVTSYAKGI